LAHLQPAFDRQFNKS